MRVPSCCVLTYFERAVCDCGGDMDLLNSIDGSYQYQCRECGLVSQNEKKLPRLIFRTQPAEDRLLIATDFQEIIVGPDSLEEYAELFDPEDEEVCEEVCEEECGEACETSYPYAQDNCYFYVHTDPNEAVNLLVSMVPINFWNEHHCCKDSSWPQTMDFECLLSRTKLYEVMDSVWEYHGRLPKEMLESILLSNGLQMNREFSEFIEDHN